MSTSFGLCGQLLFDVLSQYLFTFQRAKKTPKCCASFFFHNGISRCRLGLWIYFIMLQRRISVLNLLLIFQAEKSHSRNKQGLVCSIFRLILLIEVLNSKKDKLTLSQFMATMIDKVGCKGFPVLTTPHLHAGLFFRES